jgi:hypothetical protein
VVRELFADLRHAGERPDPHEAAAGCARARLLQGEAGRRQRGTQVRFVLRLVGDTLTQVRYCAYGCPHTLATCEWLARQLENRPLGEPIGTPADWAQRLQIPAVKLGRLLVVEDALRAALAGADVSVTKS